MDNNNCCSKVDQHFSANRMVRNVVKNDGISVILLLLFGGIPLVYVPSQIDPALLPQSIFVFIVLISGFLFLLWKYKKLIVTPNFVEKLIVLLAITSTFGIVNATDKSSVVVNVTRTLLFLLLVLFFRNVLINNKKNPVVMAFAAAINSCIQFAIVMLQQYGHLPLFGADDGFYGTMTHSNILAECMLFSLPLIVYGMVTTRGKLKKIMVSGFITCIYLIIMLKCRAVWVALFGATGIAGGICLRVEHCRSALLALRFSRSAKIIGMTIVTGVILLMIADFKEIINHAASLFHGDSSNRVTIWRETIPQVRNHWFAGVGAGNWRFTRFPFGLGNGETGFLQRPHNEYLGLLVEGGAGSLLLFIFIAITVLRRCLINIKSFPADQRYDSVITLFGMVSFFVVSAFAFPRERIVETVYLALYCAIPFSQNKYNSIYGKYVNNVVVITLLVMSIGSLLYLVQRYRCEATVKDVIDSQHMVPMEKVRKLSNVDPDIYAADPFSTPIAFYKGMAWLGAGQADSTFLYLKKAIKVYPYHPDVLLNLGTAYAQRQMPDSARKYYADAIECGPYKARPQINLAIVELQNGNPERCSEIVSQVDTTDETLDAPLKVQLKILKNKLK